VTRKLSVRLGLQVSDPPAFDRTHVAQSLTHDSLSCRRTGLHVEIKRQNTDGKTRNLKTRFRIRRTAPLNLLHLEKVGPDQV
jgi:hypothetical protein